MRLEFRTRSWAMVCGMPRWMQRGQTMLNVSSGLPAASVARSTSACMYWYSSLSFR